MSNTTFSGGWSTVSGITYGGLAAYGNYVFATDMKAAQNTSSGIIRFNINDHSAQLFAAGTGYIQVTMGQDGLLYAQYPGGSPFGYNVDVFDPNTMTLLRTISLGFSDFTNIAVDPNGNIFAVVLGDFNIYEFNKGGTLVKTFSTSVDGFSGININAFGQLEAISGYGSPDTVLFTDTSLDSHTTLFVGAFGQWVLH